MHELCAARQRGTLSDSLFAQKTGTEMKKRLYTNTTAANQRHSECYLNGAVRQMESEDAAAGGILTDGVCL